MQRLPDDLRWERRQVDPNAVFCCLRVVLRETRVSVQLCP
jgi:hypothetical protein